MKSILLIFSSLILITLNSCYTSKEYKLKGKNYGAIQIIKSPKSVDSVWSNIIDFCAQTGVSIKIIDKNSGLIVTEKYNFKRHYSFEINGKLIDTTAWVALSYISVKGGYPDNSVSVSADWNIRIKTDGAGSIINVNLTNIDAGVHFVKTNAVGASFGAPRTENIDYTLDGESTGVFEKMIIDLVK